MKDIIVNHKEGMKMKMIFYIRDYVSKEGVKFKDNNNDKEYIIIHTEDPQKFYDLISQDNYALDAISFE